MGALPSIEPLAAPMGAVVRAVDFAALTDEVVDHVRAALAQHHVLVFRGHEQPTDAQLFAFASALGTVLIDNITPEFKRPGFPGIGIMSNIVENGRPIGSTGSREVDWHTDYSFREQVSRILFLDAVEVPKRGGNTYFSDMYAALETLSPELRTQLEEMDVVHTLKYDDEVHGEYVEHARHPAVITNPDTGRRALYLSPGFHPRYPDVSEDESADLVRRLTAWATDERFVYRHDWQVGDLVMWDSIGTDHRRDGFDADDRRYMRKMSMLVEDASAPWSRPVRGEVGASR